VKEELDLADLQMTIQEHQSKLIQSLNLMGLEDWLARETDQAIDLLKRMHHAFTMGPGELGCMSRVEYDIVLDDPKPFKERFCKLHPLSRRCSMEELFSLVIDHGVTP
jgi:hypothetical protein